MSRVEHLGQHDGFIKPVFAWVPSIGISSIVVNDERLFPLWRDDLLISSLTGRSLFRVRRDGVDVQYVEPIEVGYRIRDLAQMPDGRIALLAGRGRVHFLSRSYYAHCDDESKWNRRVYAVNCGSGVDHTDAKIPDAVVAATGAQLYGTHCSSCHSLNVEEHGIGPHLVGVLGRRIGSVSGYLFSDALSASDCTKHRIFGHSSNDHPNKPLQLTTGVFPVRVPINKWWVSGFRQIPSARLSLGR